MSVEVQKLSLFGATDFRVTDGVALGDRLQGASHLVLDDVYQLGHAARPVILHVKDEPSEPRYMMAECSTSLQPDANLTFMSPDGVSFTALVLTSGNAAYLLPLDPIAPGVPYRLIACDRNDPNTRLAQATGASFVAGALVTMADGSTRPVEMLRRGDRVQTRDHGAQIIGWVGQKTRRADHATAPVTIKQAVGELSVHPAQRLFTDPASLVPVRATALADHVTTRPTGGFVDYIQLQLDVPCAIMVQGIWIESRLMDLPPPQLEQATPSSSVNAGRSPALIRHATGTIPQGLTAANVPSNMSSSAPSVTVPKTTPAIASASRP